MRNARFVSCGVPVMLCAACGVACRVACGVACGFSCVDGFQLADTISWWEYG